MRHSIRCAGCIHIWKTCIAHYKQTDLSYCLLACCRPVVSAELGLSTHLLYDGTPRLCYCRFMKACESHIHKQWMNGQQHDAQEFLRLEAIQVDACWSQDNAGACLDSAACVDIVLQLSYIPTGGSNCRRISSCLEAVWSLGSLSVRHACCTVSTCCCSGSVQLPTLCHNIENVEMQVETSLVRSTEGVCHQAKKRRCLPPRN